MAKVYVTNWNGTADLSGLEKFGEVVLMTEGHPFQSPSQLLQKFRGFAKRATINDYILLTGKSMLCSLAFAVFADHLEGDVQLLEFVPPRSSSEAPSYKLHQLSLFNTSSD